MFGSSIPVYGTGKFIAFGGMAGVSDTNTVAVTMAQYQTSGSSQYRLKLDNYNSERTVSLARKTDKFYSGGSYHPNETVGSVGSGVSADISDLPEIAFIIKY